MVCASITVARLAGVRRLLSRERDTAEKAGFVLHRPHSLTEINAILANCFSAL
jgi:hypothetical protein